MAEKFGNDQRPQPGTLIRFALLQLGDEPPWGHGEDGALAFLATSSGQEPISPVCLFVTCRPLMS